MRYMLINQCLFIILVNDTLFIGDTPESSRDRSHGVWVSQVRGLKKYRFAGDLVQAAFHAHTAELIGDQRQTTVFPQGDMLPEERCIDSATAQCEQKASSS